MAARGSDDTTVHVDGERDDVQRHGTAGVRADVGDGTVQRLERADHGAARDSHKSWSDADEVAFLNAAVAFRERTGRAGAVTVHHRLPSPHTPTRPGRPTSCNVSGTCSGKKCRGNTPQRTIAACIRDLSTPVCKKPYCSNRSNEQ
jgi:hypothetical protein